MQRYTAWSAAKTRPKRCLVFSVCQSFCLAVSTFWGCFEKSYWGAFRTIPFLERELYSSEAWCLSRFGLVGSRQKGSFGPVTSPTHTNRLVRIFFFLEDARNLILTTTKRRADVAQLPLQSLPFDLASCWDWKADKMTSTRLQYVS